MQIQIKRKNIRLFSVNLNRMRNKKIDLQMETNTYQLCCLDPQNVVNLGEYFEGSDIYDIS